MKPEEPKRVDIDKEELMGILQTVEPLLPHRQYKILEAAIKMLIWLQFSVREKSISIARLGRMLFGKKTENLKNLKNRANDEGYSSAGESAGSDGSPVNAPKEPESSSAEPKAALLDVNNFSESSSENKSEEKQSLKDPSNNNQEPPSQPAPVGTDSPTQQPTPEKKKGHGRRSLDDYNVSKIIHIPHDQLKPGEKCPLCKKGKIYYIDPEVLLVIRGQPPLKAEAYCAEGLRCNLCQAVFRATFPKEVISQPRADISARAMVCLAKYQLGTPLYRLETWQYLLGVPISDSEIWEWTESVALALFPVHQALIRIASEGEVIHNDDTTSKVLELISTL
jgi:transposase